MSIKIVDDIITEIRKSNSKGGFKSIPESDEFVNRSAASFGLQAQMIKQIIKVLVASNNVFVIEIVADDKVRNIPRVEGYVATDVSLVRKLKNHFQNELVAMYNKQFNKNLLVHQAIKEIFPLIKSLNNTPIGQIANKAIMLEEFEKLMERNFTEFTEEYKEKHLEIELSKSNLKSVFEEPKKSKDPERKSRSNKGEWGEVDIGKSVPHLSRAVDGSRYRDFVSKSRKYPLKRILNIYGSKFFLRVYLRNFEFQYLKKLIKDGQIDKRDDLLQLKEMLSKMKNNINSNPELKGHIDSIYELERVISHHIYFSDRGVGERRY